MTRVLEQLSADGGKRHLEADSVDEQTSGSLSCSHLFLVPADNLPARERLAYS